MFSEVDYIETWQAMEEAVSSGTKVYWRVELSTRNRWSVCWMKERSNQTSTRLSVIPTSTRRRWLIFAASKEIYVTAPTAPRNLTDLGQAWRPPAHGGTQDCNHCWKVQKTPAQSPHPLPDPAWDIIASQKSITKSRIESNLQVFDTLTGGHRHLTPLTVMVRVCTWTG